MKHFYFLWILLTIPICLSAQQLTIEEQNEISQANQALALMNLNNQQPSFGGFDYGTDDAMENFIPTAGATETFEPAIGDFFYDTGGPGGGGLNPSGGPGTELPGNYLNCGCVTTTTLSGVTEIEFHEFEVFGDFDWLKVYDGADTSGAVLYDSNSNSDTDTYAGMIALNGSGVFTGTSGAITFEFNATGVVDHTGWEVEILAADGGSGTTDCSGGPGLIIHDDGTIENGGSGNPAIVTEVRFVDKFTPSGYPATIESVCSAFIMLAGGTSDLPYDIVVYDDDGAGGAPGTLIGELSGLTAVDIPVFSAGAAPVWQSADTSSENWEITEGSVYIGVRFAPTTPNHFIATDETSTTPAGEGYWWNDNAGTWSTIASGFPGYRSLFVRPVLSDEGGGPDPEYCGPITFEFGVEPITRVVFSDIDNPSSVDTTSPAHEDFTSIVGNVDAGETYQIAVEGYTGGDWEDFITVFIDWNQNGILDDAGEIYEIGSIFNSTGTDGIQVIADIAVPADATEGETRMRVFKTYDVPNDSNIDPCAMDQNYGQVEDYTINVGGGSPGDGCEWTVTVSGSGLGDEVSWELRDSSGVILSGGPYNDIPYSDTQSVNSEGPVEFYIETMGDWNDNTPSFSVANGNGVIISGNAMGGTETTYSDISCEDTPPPPPSACTDFVVLSNNLENGLFFEGDTAQHLAVDVPVADQGFTVYGMEPTVIGEASMFTFIIYEDAGGLPGAEIDTKTGTIVGEEYTGTNFGYDFYKYSVAFDSSIDFAANTTYWIEIQSDAVAWESESVLTLGNDDVFYNTNVGEGVWTPTGGDQFVFNLACEPLAINDMNSFSFAYYPNPVKDYLTIDAKKAIENITVHNLAGQTVLQGAKAVDGRVNMSSLSAGVYVFRVTLEGGQVETFKVIKK